MCILVCVCVCVRACILVYASKCELEREDLIESSCSSEAALERSQRVGGRVGGARGWGWMGTREEGGGGAESLGVDEDSI